MLGHLRSKEQARNLYQAQAMLTFPPNQPCLALPAGSDHPAWRPSAATTAICHNCDMLGMLRLPCLEGVSKAGVASMLSAMPLALDTVRFSPSTCLHSHSQGQGRENKAQAFCQLVQDGVLPTPITPSCCYDDCSCNGCRHALQPACLPGIC